MEESKVIVQLNGARIIAERNPDPDYDGITIYLETDKGDLITLTRIEADKEDKKKILQQYTYEDIYNEDWTRKVNYYIDEVKEMFEEEKEK